MEDKAVGLLVFIGVVFSLVFLGIAVTSCDNNNSYGGRPAYRSESFKQSQERFQREENHAWLTDVCSKYPSTCRK